MDSESLPSASLLRILELTKKLSVPYELSDMLAEVLQAGLDVLKADSGSLWLYDESSDELRMHLPVVDPPITVRSGEGLVGECLSTNEIINVPDCYADPRFNPAVDKKTGYKTESILSIPLIGFDRRRVGVLQLLNKEGGAFGDVDEHLATALAAQSAIALQRAEMTASLIAKERLDEEIEIARQVQMSTLPDEMPEVEGYDFASGFIPAEYTGGDLFDLVLLGDEVFFLVGDATGHGFGPALSATQMQAMFRVAFRVGASLNDAYIHVNNQLVEDLQDNKFLTAFMGFLDPARHEIRYHSAGQGPIVHYRTETGDCDWHPPTSFPVGVMEFDEAAEPQRVQLAPGDIFAVISDGVFEYHNKAGEQFGEARVQEIFRRFEGGSMEVLRDQLLAELFAFADGAEQVDDITIVLAHRTSDGVAAASSDAAGEMTLSLARDVGELSRIVSATHQFFDANGIDTAILNTVDFAIEEMFVNLVKYNTMTDERVDLRLAPDGDGVRVTLTDYNVDRYDPTERAPVDVDAPLEERTPGGLGVFLTIKLADAFSYDYDNRTSTITFVKRQERATDV